MTIFYKSNSTKSYVRNNKNNHLSLQNDENSRDVKLSFIIGTNPFELHCCVKSYNYIKLK